MCPRGLRDRAPSSKWCFRASFLPTCPPIHAPNCPLIPPASLSFLHPSFYPLTYFLCPHLSTHPPNNLPSSSHTATHPAVHTSIHSFIHFLFHLLSFHPSTHPPIHLPEITAGVPRPGRAFPRLTTSTPGLRQAKLSPDCLFVPVFLLNHLRGLVGVCGKKQPPPRTCEADGWGPGGGCEGSALQAV